MLEELNMKKYQNKLELAKSSLTRAYTKKKVKTKEEKEKEEEKKMKDDF